MPPPRQNIVELLRVFGEADASQMAEQLERTPASIRRHLQSLIDEGIVEEVGLVQSGGRGRPVRRFRLSHLHQENQIPRLAQALLRTIALPDNPAGIDRLASALIGDISHHLIPGAIRNNQAVQQLNVLGYNAHWEASRQAPSLILRHCPYRALVDDHPELCQIDEAVISRLTGTQAQQTAKLEPHPGGGWRCKFQLYPSPK